MSVRELSTPECRRLLRSRRLGRVVFTDHALPSAMPVDYLLTTHGILFRVAPGGLLDRLLDGAGEAVLGFEADEVDDCFESGWSVLVVGLAVRLEPGEAHRLTGGVPLRSCGAGDEGSFVLIPLTRVSGRALEVAGRPLLTVADGSAPVANPRPVA